APTSSLTPEGGKRGALERGQRRARPRRLAKGEVWVQGERSAQLEHRDSLAPERGGDHAGEVVEHRIVGAQAERPMRGARRLGPSAGPVARPAKRVVAEDVAARSGLEPR